jgi:integrase
LYQGARNRKREEQAAKRAMSATGLRIRDVVTLTKKHMVKGKLYLRTSKTGTDVFCPLPPSVIQALDAVGAKGDQYFWTGASKPKSAVGNYQRALRTLFDLAELPHIHAHLFRHTFVTELLTAGNSLETVAALLGHSSTNLTAKSCVRPFFGCKSRYLARGGTAFCPSAFTSANS